LALQNQHDTFQSVPEGARKRYDYAEIRKHDEVEMLVTPRITIQEEERARLDIEVPSQGIAAGTVLYANGASRQANPNFRDLEELAARSRAANDAEVGVAEAAISVSKAEYEARKGVQQAISQSNVRKDQFNYERAQAQNAQAQAEKALPDLIAGRQPATEASHLTANPTDQTLGVPTITYRGRGERPGTEQYDPIIENTFLSPLHQPLSTFSIDVDTASYANMRRFLTSGRLPPSSSVRIEELVNYFRYEYAAPNRS